MRKRPRIAKTIERLREKGCEDFTITDVRRQPGAKRISPSSIAESLASRSMQLCYGFKLDAFERRCDHRGRPHMMRVYVFVDPDPDGFLCHLSRRRCHFAGRLAGVPSYVTFDNYCLDMCEGIEDGPFVNRAEERIMGSHTAGQKIGYIRLWKKRYGDQDVEDAGKVPG